MNTRTPQCYFRQLLTFVISFTYLVSLSRVRGPKVFVPSRNVLRPQYLNFSACCNKLLRQTAFAPLSPTSRHEASEPERHRSGQSSASLAPQPPPAHPQPRNYSARGFSARRAASQPQRASRQQAMNPFQPGEFGFHGAQQAEDAWVCFGTGCGLFSVFFGGFLTDFCV